MFYLSVMVVGIDSNERRVETLSGVRYDYDRLVIATGCDIHPEEIEGMLDVWRTDIFDFYTLDVSVALAKKLRYFDSGRVVLNIAEFPYKCPIAPLAFVFMAGWFFTVNGVRDRVQIEFVTPLDNVFTKPVAAKALAEVEADFQLEDMLYFIKKVLRNLKNLNYTLDQLKNNIGFTVTVEPLLKSSVPQLIFYLDELERSGVFRMFNEMLAVMKKIGANDSQEDWGQVGAGMARLADSLKTLTQPQSIELIERAAALPQSIDLSAAKPTGPLGLFIALRDTEARKRLGVLVELTKALPRCSPRRKRLADRRDQTRPLTVAQALFADECNSERMAASQALVGGPLAGPCLWYHVQTGRLTCI